MHHFTIKRSFWLDPLVICEEKLQKIDKFMELLEQSNVWKILENVKKEDKKRQGRSDYNIYNLFAMIVYCFSKFKSYIKRYRR